MIRRRLLPLLCLPVLCAAALGGCGEDESASVDLARAAAATSQKGTARVTMKVHVTGMGLPDGIDATAEGVTALGEPRMAIAMDFGALLAAAGVDSQARVELRLDGRHLYVKPPEIQALNLPAWIALDLRRVGRAMGIDPDAAAVLFTMDAASQLRALRAAGSLEEVGSEEIDGVRTTHLKGTTSPRDTIAALPPAKRAKATRALEQIARISGQDPLDQRVPTELWVGEDSVVRRMRLQTELPAQPGVDPGHMTMTYELRDFGARLDVSRPAGAVDYTGKLVRLMTAGLRAQGVAPSG